MKTAIDTNVFSALWAGEKTSAGLHEQLGEASAQGALVICPVVFAEMHANPKMDEKLIRRFLDETGVFIEYHLQEAVWIEAGRRYAQYCRRRRSAGEEPRRLIADFVIGAHALLQADRLITLDRSRYRKDFPELILSD